MRTQSISGDDQEQPRPLDRRELAQAEHDRALPFRGQTDRGGEHGVGEGPHAEQRHRAVRRFAPAVGGQQPGQEQNDEHDLGDIVDHRILPICRRGELTGSGWDVPYQVEATRCLAWIRP
jgi:hypothetical protein